MRDIYADFLSEEEISDMIDDRDIWMGSTEVLARLEKRGKIIEKKNKAARKKYETSEPK